MKFKVIPDQSVERECYQSGDWWAIVNNSGVIVAMVCNRLHADALLEKINSRGFEPFKAQKMADNP